MSISKRINKKLIGGVLGGTILIFLLMFFVVCGRISNEVDKQCETAQGRYGGKCVDALMDQVADESSQSGKNRAIWALGQLGDKKALPFLEDYINGQPLPDHESWEEGISQYELRKAVKLLKGGFNLSALCRKN